ncbi:MAG: hypothetical protein ACKVQU_15475 [Burkholderiales bacterium]
MMTKAEIERTIDCNRQWFSTVEPRTAPPSVLEPEQKSETMTLIIANAVGAAILVLLMLGAGGLHQTARQAGTPSSSNAQAPAVRPAADVNDRESKGSLSIAWTHNAGPQER